MVHTRGEEQKQLARHTQRKRVGLQTAEAVRRQPYGGVDRMSITPRRAAVRCRLPLSSDGVNVVKLEERVAGRQGRAATT